MDQSLQMRPAVPATSQATRIEQSRAEAEVLAAVMAARQFPRDVESARAEMQRACRSMSVAETAFFDFNRGDGTVRGETIHLAKELALIWGNLDFGVMELSRDDVARRSEVLAFAKDLERNTRSSAIFISPHKRDVKTGAKDLASLRDVYENNANMGARRLREAIWAVLPNWFRAEASEICRQTLSQTKPGQTWEQRVESTVAMYLAVGVPLALLEEKVKRPLKNWGETEVVDLEITYRSVARGDIKRDDAFPPPRVTIEEAAKPAVTPEPGATTADAPASEEPSAATVQAGPPLAADEGEPAAPIMAGWQTAWREVGGIASELGWDEARAKAEFAEKNPTVPFDKSSVDDLRFFADHLRTLTPAGVA
jgi:hypothetical protein